MPPKKVEKNSEKKVVKKISKEKDPNEPKKNKSAYMFYCVDGRLDIKKENPEVDNKSIIVELGVRWTKLKESDPEKLKYYNDLAEQDKKRYQEEKSQYVKSDKDETEVVEKKPKKKSDSKSTSSSDPVEPKKKTKVNGYINYCTKNREQYKLDNPGVLPKDITRKLSEGWKLLSDDEKEQFKY